MVYLVSSKLCRVSRCRPINLFESRGIHCIFSCDSTGTAAYLATHMPIDSAEKVLPV